MPKGLRKFRFVVGKPGLTRFGGLSLFHLFCSTLWLRRFLQTHVEWPSYPHRAYHPVDLWLAHLVAIVAGIGRIENTQSLLHNGLIPPLLGLPDFPHRDTLRTFLWRFGPPALRSLEAAHDRVRAELFHRLGLRYDAIVDADTTAVITYGHQEGIARGYIPKRRHRQGSYAPILSSEGRTGLSLGAELRAGNVPSVTGAWPFLAAQLDKLPNTVAHARTRMRLDGAFYDKDITQPLDGKRIGYVIVAKMTQPLKDRMVAAPYHEFREGWEAAEFTSTPFHWQQAHRFVAVRRPVTYEPEEAQRHLFTFKRYTYRRALVTNLPLTPEAVWRCYCDRAAQELLLREFKSAYHLAAIPTRSFWANATYLELVLWAYDLVRAFQVFCLPPAYRHWNIWLPAKYPHAELLDRVQRAISRVKPLI